MDVIDRLHEHLREVVSSGDEHRVIATVRFDATTDDLWAAVSTPRLLAVWFEAPSGELHEGGRYRLDRSRTAGVIDRCDAPRLLRVTWEAGGSASIVEARVQEAPGGATLRLTHALPDDEHWERYGPAAVGTGWDGALVALHLMLGADDHDVTAEDLAAQMPDAFRLAMVPVSTRAWSAAHAAGGANPDDAAARAARTEAFYTGGEPDTVRPAQRGKLARATERGRLGSGG